MAGKLCIVYNFAQLYRQPIFTLIDNEWDCEWWFGDNESDVKEMPEDALKHSHRVKNRHIVGALETQVGVSSLIRRKDIDTFLMLGEPMVLSTWLVMMQRQLFYRKKRVYLWSHGWYGREGFAKKWIKRVFFGMADHVFTYGQYAKEQAIKQGYNGEKITPIHNSLNHDLQVELRSKLSQSDVYRSHFGNDNPTLIFIGRLTPSKQLDMALNAVKLLADRGQMFNIVLIGDGADRRRLEQLSNELGIEKNVWFYGACYDDHENASLIYNADLCVSPGNVGLTAIHTMVFSTPVITHNDFRWQGPEFEAIQPGVTGDFFERGNVESLANAIEQWFAGHPDREQVRRDCYRVIDTEWTPEYQLNVLKQFI